jgi:hypothetical protein
MDEDRGKLNPAHIVVVVDFSPQTLRNMIAHLEVSTDFEHLVYRESELDAIWSISGFVLKYGLATDRASLSRLHEYAHVAHDLVADGRPREAAEILRTCL